MKPSRDEPAAESITQGVEAVTFDCWGTLLFEVNGPAVYARRVERLAASAARFGVPTPIERAREALDAAWHEHWEHWNTGRPSGAFEIAQSALAALDVAAAGAAESFVEQLDSTVRAHEVRVLPGARATLLRMRRAGLRLALVCDTGMTSGTGVRRLLDAQGLLELLQVQAFSDEAGVPKPHPQIFQRALRELGARAERSVHVGDLRRTDVAGARALGMTTIRIRGAHDDTSEHPEADAVVDSHRELSALFGLEIPDGD